MLLWIWGEGEGCLTGDWPASLCSGFWGGGNVAFGLCGRPKAFNCVREWPLGLPRKLCGVARVVDAGCCLGLLGELPGCIGCDDGT